MKTKLLLVGLLMMTAFAAHAQSEVGTAKLQTNLTKARKASTVKLIPTLGLSSSIVDISNKPSGVYSDPQSGMNGGVLIEVGQGRVAWQSGLLYLQEGVRLRTFQWEFQGLNYDIYSNNSSGHVNYLAIPALVKVNFPPQQRSARFSVKGGLMPALLTSVKVSSSSTRDENGKTTQESEEVTTTDGLRAVNLMALLGIAGEFPIGGDNDIRIEGQLNRGLLPVQERESGSNMYTQSFMLTIGMGFGL